VASERSDNNQKQRRQWLALIIVNCLLLAFHAFAQFIPVSGFREFRPQLGVLTLAFIGLMALSLRSKWVLYCLGYLGPALALFEFYVTHNLAFLIFYVLPFFYILQYKAQH
jgi:hypothetical protein